MKHLVLILTIVVFGVVGTVTALGLERQFSLEDRV